MKKLTVSILFLCLSLSAFSQEKREVYCQILATSKFLSSKINITIDHGEHMSMWKDNRMRDEETGKAKTFNSVVDALNYMSGQGWKFVNAYAITVSNQNVYHYLMMKEVDASEITEGK